MSVALKVYDTLIGYLELKGKNKIKSLTCNKLLKTYPKYVKTTGLCASMKAGNIRIVVNEVGRGTKRKRVVIKFEKKII